MRNRAFRDDKDDKAEPESRKRATDEDEKCEETDSRGDDDTGVFPTGAGIEKGIYPPFRISCARTILVSIDISCDLGPRAD